MKLLRDSSYKGSRNIQYIDKTESSIRMFSAIAFLVIFSVSVWPDLLLRWHYLLFNPVESATMNLISTFAVYFIFGSLPILAILCFILGPWLLARKQVVTPLSEAYSSVNKMVNECSKEVGLKSTPKAYVIQNQGADCFVFGRSSNNARLLISNHLLASLTKDELRACILHEFAHVKNGDMAFMTWGVSFQRSLKYWLALYTIALFTCPILLERIPIYSLSPYRILLMILGGRVLEGSPLFLVTTFIFVTATVNSVSRVRELLADAYASNVIEGSKLISAIKKAYLCQLTGSILRSMHVKRFYRKLAHRVSSSMPKFLIRHYMRHHPSLKDRVTSVKNMKLAFSSKRICVPSFETYVYVGIVGSLVLIGTKHFLLNLTIMLSSAGIYFDLYTTNLGWWAGVIPSLVLTMLLNNLFVLRSDPKTYITRRGRKLHLNEDFVKAVTTRIAVSSASFFILSFFAFIGVSGFFYLMFDPNSLSRLLWAIFLGFYFSLMSFVLSGILLLIILFFRRYSLARVALHCRNNEI